MTDKQYKSVAEVFEETKDKLANPVEKMDYDPVHDMNNVNELQKINARIYEMAQEYGSNSSEAYNLLTAYDRIHDAHEDIELGVRTDPIQMESKVEQKSAIISNVNTVIDFLAVGLGPLKKVAEKVLKAQKEADRGNYDKVKKLFEEAKREFSGGNQLSQGVERQFDQVFSDLTQRMSRGTISYEGDLREGLQAKVEHATRLLNSLNFGDDENYQSWLEMRYDDLHDVEHYASMGNSETLQLVMSDFVNAINTSGFAQKRFTVEEVFK